ncbi:MAG: 3-phosphoshikimate 1-carboxyvinyltransferase, partial [Bacteroidota bacterium]|nr:3-phosphoshikimate 1-carboxyvinyltransferase [Bacteroidota bacterium]
ESNRALLLQALYNGFTIQNLSNSDDSKLMKNALSSKATNIDIHHAGTAMRFLTAYYAVNMGKTTILTGSERMQQRPIKVLVDALNSLGAHIGYIKNEGYPPLLIKGRQFSKKIVYLKSDISSQYISALLLIAPSLKNGLELHLEGKITSLPYIKMTLALLDEMGVETKFEGNVIRVLPLSNQVSKIFTVESDWSSASYYYSILALSNVGTQIDLSDYKSESLQGDAVLRNIYKKLGVDSSFFGTILSLKKVQRPLPACLALDLSDTPDIAQTIVVSCLGLEIDCDLTGLHTLKIKETDRLVALKNEIKKLGSELKITGNSLHLNNVASLNCDVHIATYNDHRMAMAFAPLALRASLYIENAEVVSKSYPNFWEDLKSLGFKFQ